MSDPSNESLSKNIWLLFSSKDPDELNDISNGNPELVKELDNLLRQAIDYEGVDAEVKKQHRSLFNEYFYSSLWTKIYETLAHHSNIMTFSIRNVLMLFLCRVDYTWIKG